MKSNKEVTDAMVEFANAKESLLVLQPPASADRSAMCMRSTIESRDGVKGELTTTFGEAPILEECAYCHTGRP